MVSTAPLHGYDVPSIGTDAAFGVKLLGVARRGFSFCADAVFRLSYTAPRDGFHFRERGLRWKITAALPSLLTRMGRDEASKDVIVHYHVNQLMALDSHHFTSQQPSIIILRE